MSSCVDVIFRPFLYSVLVALFSQENLTLVRKIILGGI
jgi:hypothetical protein